MPENDKKPQLFDDLLTPPPGWTEGGGKLAIESMGDALAKRALSAVSGGISGASLGSYGGVPGTLIGGGVGAAYGATFPSEAPMTDLGSNALSTAVGMIPGVRQARMLLKAPAMIGATGVGAAVGSMGDRQANFIHETPYGMIGVYMGLDALGLAGEAIARTVKPTGAYKSAQELQAVLGEDTAYPLSVGEATGKLRGLEQMTAAGTRKYAQLGTAQSEYGQRAIEKILGTKLNRAVEDIEGTSKALGPKLRGTTEPFIDLKSVTNPLSGAQTQQKVMNWKKFGKAYGLDRYEVSAFQSVLQQSPSNVVQSFFGTGRNAIARENLDALRSVAKVLEQEDPVLLGRLGTAMVQTMLLSRRVTSQLDDAGNVVLSGKKLVEALTNDAVLGLDRLTYVLGKDRAKALVTLAEVMEQTNPVNKMNTGARNLDKTALSYTWNKGVFTIGSLARNVTTGAGAAAGGMAGGATGGIPGMVAGAGLGMAAGATLSIGFSGMVRLVMTNPQMAEHLLMASRGDAAAATRVIRTLMSPVVSDKLTAHEQVQGRPPESSPVTKLKGLFTRP